jgi:hypothetical protein
MMYIFFMLLIPLQSPWLVERLSPSWRSYVCGRRNPESFPGLSKKRPGCRDTEPKHERLKREITIVREEKIRLMRNPPPSQTGGTFMFFYISFLDFRKSLATVLGFPPVSNDFISFR